MLRRALITSLVLVSPGLRADEPADYYHRGVKHYVFSEDEQARAVIQEGIQKFPDDPKLSRLSGLLKEKEQKQQQTGNQGQQNQDQEQEQSAGQQNQQDQNQQDQSAGQDDQQQPDQGQQPQPQSGQEGDDGEQANAQEQPAAPEETPPGEMSPEQARQLLEAARGDEKHWSEAARREASANVPVSKPW